jgi:hypothetical protein
MKILILGVANVGFSAQKNNEIHITAMIGKPVSLIKQL